MARHKRRLKVNKLLLPVALILAVSAFVIAAAMYGYKNPSPSTEPEPAAGYFEIVQPTVTQFNETSQSGTYIIMAIGFQIKAVKGDAHSVVIQSWKGGDYVQVGDLKQNQTQWVELHTSSYGFPVTPVNGSQFQTSIRVTSEEAAGDITFWIYE